MVSGKRLKPLLGSSPELVALVAESRDGAVEVIREDGDPAATAWAGATALAAQVRTRAARRADFTGCDTLDHCRNQVLAGE
jgi:predicted nicotinamide N-methyase